MATVQAQIVFGVGEDVQEVLTVYNSTGQSTVNITGWAMNFTATYPGGLSAVTLSTGAGTIAAASPLPCQATLTFASAVTASLPPQYYDFEIRRTDAGSNGEVTTGSLLLNP
jgi:hypothetical protein